MISGFVWHSNKYSNKYRIDICGRGMNSSSTFHRESIEKKQWIAQDLLPIVFCFGSVLVIKAAIVVPGPGSKKLGILI